ncbi:MAG: hypothetical protein ACRD0P_37580, partial [Stackebrandtia sp.]
MSTVEKGRTTVIDPVTPIAAVGAVVTLAAGGLALADAGGLLREHLHQVYDEHLSATEVDGSVSSIATYLAVIAGLGIVGWLATWWAHQRGKRWAAGAGTGIFIVAALVVVTSVTITEYGQTILPPLYNSLLLASVLVGVIAVVLLSFVFAPVSASLTRAGRELTQYLEGMREYI